MDERQRMQYLDAMGIDSFMPRLILPNAKRSSLCELPVAKAEVSVAPVSSSQAQAADSQPLVSPRLSLISDQLDETPDVKRPISVVETSIEPKESGADKQGDATKNNISPAPLPPSDKTEALEADKTPAKFSLQLWRVSEDILVIDSKNPAEALPCEKLLLNILAALKVGNGLLPASDKLQWPLVNDRLKDDSWGAANEMVHYFLEGRLFTSPVRALFLFGLNAQKTVLGAAFEEPLAKSTGTSITPKKVALDAFACDAYCFESLGNILKTPSLKKSIWNLLRSHYIEPGAQKVLS